LQFDVKRVVPSGNFQNHIPETEIQRIIIKNNRDKILWFLEDYVNDYINDPCNSEFFNSFSKDIVDNKDALRVIYEYLMKFEVKRVITSGNFQNHIPETDIQKVIINNNRDKILWFLEDYVNDYINDPCNTESAEVKLKNSEVFAKWNIIGLREIKLISNIIILLFILDWQY
jgi:hypothetical protein